VVDTFPVSIPSQLGPAQLSDPSLAITPGGTAVIAYRFDDGLQSGAASEMHVAISGASFAIWTTQVIDSGGLNDVGHSPSVAIRSTPAQEPAVAYEDRTSNRILYSEATDGGGVLSWSGPEVVANDASAPSLATNGSTIAVSFYDESTNSLNYATRSGASWSYQPVDPASQTGVESSLAFTAAGNPVIAYHDAASNRLKIAEWDGSAWQISVVTDSVYSAVAGGTSPDLAVLPSGNLGVSCLANIGDSGSGEAIYLERTGSTWSRFPVHYPCSSPALAVNQLGNPLVSCYREYQSSIDYVYNNDPLTILLGGTSIDYTKLVYLPGALLIVTPK
jgi:hypothetical protein